MGKAVLIWVALAVAVLVPLVAALFSPLLAWREPVYIAAGFAGIVGLALLLVQPLLAAGVLPGVEGRRAHRLVGGALVLAVVVHVAGLWITSPPDVIDALLLVSPTPFSIWGVLAMWGVFGTAVLAARRRRIRPLVWRRAHLVLGLVIAGGTSIHAVLIEGTMEQVSKLALCVLVSAATGFVLRKRWR